MNNSIKIIVLKTLHSTKISFTFLVCFLLFHLLASSSTNNEQTNKLFTYQKNNIVFATNDSLNTISLTLNEKTLSKLINNRSITHNISLPIGFKYFDFTFEKNDFFNSELKIISKTNFGDEKLDFDPEFISYKILHKKNIVGVISFYDGIIDCSLSHKGQQYEITNFQGSYFLIKVSDSKEKSDFKCTLKEYKKYTPRISTPKSSSQLQQCIQMAIEVDYYTRNTFSSNSAATNWALAIMAGVSQLYESQANVSITVDYIYFWNTADQYSA